MSDLGWGAGGVAEALQLVQNLQGGQLDNQKKQVQLQMDQMQLENLKKLQSTLGGQAFGAAMNGQDPSAQSKALMNLAETYLSANMPQQAGSVVEMATSLSRSQSYAMEQQANAAKKYIDMAEDLFSGVTNAQQWAQAQQFLQSQLPPDAMQNPVVKGLLTGAYSPDKVAILPQFLDRLKARAQIALDQSKANTEEAQQKYYSFEDRRAAAQTDEFKARADYLRRNGAGGLVPNKEEITAAANDLQTLYPEEEAEPVVQGGKITDSAAVRGNYKARVQASATQVAEAAQAYVKQGMKPGDARKRAIQEADERGDLNSLKPSQGASRGTPGGASKDKTAETWGDPSVVGQQ